MSRIVIEDLAEVQELSDLELQEIYGAGRPIRRKSRESFPGIVHLEVLERREVFSATGLQGVVQAPTATAITAEMQGSKVEKDAAGNTVLTQFEQGQVIAKAVFSPAGQIVSFEQARGDIRSVARFENGKLVSISSSRGSVPTLRQEFRLDGTVSKETQFDAQGKVAVETIFTGVNRQVTTYVEGKTARLQTFGANAEIPIYEETWSAGIRITRTWNTDAGTLKSKWEKNGNYEVETTVANGVRDERTYLVRTQVLARENRSIVTRTQVLHEQYSEHKGLYSEFASLLAQEKKLGHVVTNEEQARSLITALSEKPTLRETWAETGNLLTEEKWSYQAGAIMLTPGQPLSVIVISTRQSIRTYDPKNSNRQVSEDKLNGVCVERKQTLNGVTLEVETWNNRGEQLTRKVYGTNWTESYDYETETIGTGKSKTTKTYIAVISFRRNGNLERREWFNADQIITQRYYYSTENGKLRTTLRETFSGTTHQVNDLTTPGQSTISILTYQRLEKNVPVNERLIQTQGFKGDVLEEETRFHSNEKVASYWYRVNSQTSVRTYYNEAGQKTEQWVLRDGSSNGEPESHRVYDPATGRDLRFYVFDSNGHMVHKVTWDYLSNGDVVKKARDYQNKGTQEIQRREWVNGLASAFYVLDWSFMKTTWVCIVERHYESGRKVSDVERAPDGSLLKEFTWTWSKVATLTSWNWQSRQVKSVGKSCYNLTMEPGFSLSWKNAQDAYDSAGAVVSDPGEWVEGNIIDPTVEAAKQKAEEARRIEATIVRLKDKIEASSLSLVTRIKSVRPTLEGANAALRALRKSPLGKLSLKELRDNANSGKQRALTEANTVVQVVKDVPRDTAAARDAALNGARSTLQAVTEPVTNARNGITIDATSINSKVNGVVKAGDEVWKKTRKAAEPIINAIKGVLSEDLIKVEADSVGKLSFNFATGSYYADFELLKGLKIDTAEFRALMSGDFRLPEIDPLTAAASLSGLKTSVETNYESVRQEQYVQNAKYGSANVYFASRRLTEWAGPGTAIRDGVAAAFGDSAQAISEAKSYLSLELEDIVTWLKQRGAAAAPKLAAQILNAVVTQTSLDLPELKLSVTPVRYTYTYSAGGTVGSAANAVGVNAGTSASANHFGFAIAWKGASGKDPLLNSIDNMESMKLKGGMDDFNALVMKEISKLKLPGSKFLGEILLTGHVGVDSDDAADKWAVAKLSEMLGINAAELKASYKAGNPIIDLSQNARIRDKIVLQLGKLAIGNEGSAEVTKLQFNLNTLSFEVEFVVHHKFASGSLADYGKKIVAGVT